MRIRNKDRDRECAYCDRTETDCNIYGTECVERGDERDVERRILGRATLESTEMRAKGSEVKGVRENGKDGDRAS